MSLALEMFAVAPATGNANLSGAQRGLLVGKARWIRAVWEADAPVVPTILISHAAWAALQAERRRHEDRLRAHWVATLFRLVGRDGVPPSLVVRTATDATIPGLMPARAGLPAPASEAEAVDPNRPLGRAIDDAFESYGDDANGAIVLVQAMARGEIAQFLSRDATSGALGPAPVPGRPFPPQPDAAALCEVIDRAALRHMCLTVALTDRTTTFLSARPYQASAAAELQAATDRVERGTWSREQAVAGVSPDRLQALLHPSIRAGHAAEAVATGLGVSPGAASGGIVFTAEDAARWKARGRHCILVVNETGPADIDGMKAATGILTARGGMTSHAGVIARITGKPCVAGVRSLSVDAADMSCRIGDRVLRGGDRITIDGSDGSVYLGTLPLSQPHIGGALGELLDWSDASRTIAVRANAETVEAAKTALSFGAQGIGLARSEHMFFSRERMVALRRLILSEDEDARKAALTGLVDFQTGDYSAIFSTMAGRPVTVRLFDPPLHEFLPRTEEDIDETAKSLGLELRALKLRLERITEINPMLGHRGVRLAVTYPEILEMQLQALLAGVRAAMAGGGEPVALEIMVPFVSTTHEVIWIRERVMELVDAANLPPEARRRFAFGTMIELPRAALRAGDIARHVDFFSFGTNDLTQTTFGISRDDAPAFLAAYQRKGLYAQDPFVTLDQKGVGELISIAIERGRAANPALKIGICGEHAGDPASLAFFAGLGIDYVSCSPYRVPVARLALAQASH
ncbi:MAG: pyruvate, phosphate dikinase [Devosia nanyangense]|uniref:Pyruvate, phosphate dikinase n=1 Tax=Devosia nanyangense TaxID=1228055 RepID=A0A933L296_9HYPH|nr:pyruvate, phosphate dikinase [Devosia nanyangense]